MTSSQSDRAPNSFVAVGLRKGRIEALHDGIYAVAMTLLVLDLYVPQGAQTFAAFMRQLRAEGPQFAAAAVAFSVVGLMWINNYYRNSMVVRVDFTHIALSLAASGASVLVPFSTRILAEYWFYPWGITIFSWNIAFAVLLYVASAHHYIRHLIPRQVDAAFLRRNLLFMWFFAIVSAVVVPALALLSTLAAVVSIALFAALNVVSMLRMQPKFIEAHRVAVVHEEDDLRVTS